MNQRVLRAVDVELTAAAAERWVAPVEGFLWRARRCAEAMLYALLVEAKVDVTQLAEQGKGLDNLAKHAKLQGVIPREMRNHLEGVQKYGNTAAHFQADGPASDASASIVASALCEFARWFYTRDDRALPDALQGPLVALIDERQRLRSSVELALEQERRRTHELTQQLRAAATPPVDRPPPPFTAHLAAIGVGLALIGGAFGFGAGWLFHEPEPTVGAPTLTRAPAPTSAPAPVSPPSSPPPLSTPEGLRSAAPLPTSELAPNTPAGRNDCEHLGMRFVGVPGAPGTFCIDREPVAEGEYRQCVPRNQCPPPPRVTENGANWNNPEGGDGFAANFLPARWAHAYCQQRFGPPGGLPTFDERSRAAQARATAVARGTTEWLGDAPTNGRRGVWGESEPRDESVGYRNVSFRCVLRAVPP
jgi:hypothetical protein